MIVERLIFDVTVAVRSPFSFADVDAAGIGIDTPALRDRHGVALLPARHLKGLLREAFRALKPYMDTLGLNEDKLFGQKPLSGMAPERGELLFADLTLSNQPGARQNLTRIEIDDERGTVTTGMLQVVELAMAPGAEGLFTGELILHGDATEAAMIAEALTRALRIVPYFGGMRSSGFGEHMRESSSIVFKHREHIRDAGVPAASTYTVTFKLDRPYATGVGQIAENVFLGSEVIPGAAIKGALADMLRKLHGGAIPSDVDQALSAARISHAYPVGSDGRLQGRALPLSVVSFDGKEFRDELGNETDPGFHAARNICGDFLPDMKPGVVSELRDLIGRPKADFPQYALGHTAIDMATGTAADGQLFVVIARDPGDSHFRFSLTLGGKSEADRCIAQTIGGGIDAIGKTNARMRNTVPMPSHVADVRSDGSRRILLETPSPFVLPLSDSTQSYDKLLRDYFTAVDPALVLEDAYFQTEIAGGYAAKNGRQSQYQPLRLVVAGSCFQFEASSELQPALDRLATTGLPVLRQDAQGFHRVTDWSECLFLPENGFGEVTVDGSPFANLKRASA